MLEVCERKTHSIPIMNSNVVHIPQNVLHEYTIQHDCLHPIQEDFMLQSMVTVNAGMFHKESIAVLNVLLTVIYLKC